MASEPIIHITPRNRLKLCFEECIGHYQLLTFALIPPFLVLSLRFSKSDAYPVMIRNDVSLTWVLLSSSMLFIFLFIILRNKLKLVPINTTLKTEILKMLIEKLAEQKGWYIKYNCLDTMVITSYLQISLGMRNVIGEQQIIILFKENKILINSRTNNEEPYIPFSFGKNRRNIRLIKKNIMDVERLLDKTTEKEIDLKLECV